MVCESLDRSRDGERVLGDMGGDVMGESIIESIDQATDGGSGDSIGEVFKPDAGIGKGARRGKSDMGEVATGNSNISGLITGSGTTKGERATSRSQ